SQPSNVYGLGTYSLNAFRAVGEQSGTGWAVGDHGAIVALGPATPPGTDPLPPVLGSPDPAAQPTDDPFTPFQPLPMATEPGRVPSLIERPIEDADHAVAVPYGSPDPEEPPGTEAWQIVMSQDGSEGWAFAGAPPSAPAAGQTPVALYHYFGGQWAT